MKIRRFLIFLVGLSMPFNNVAPIPNFSMGLFSSTLKIMSEHYNRLQQAQL